MRLRPATMILAALFSFPVTAAAQEIGDSARGLDYAKQHCGECHSVGGDQKAPLVPRGPAFEQVANTPGMTRIALTVWFRTPHPLMPNIIVAPADQDDLIAYILSLKKSSP